MSAVLTAGVVGAGAVATGVRTAIASMPGFRAVEESDPAALCADPAVDAVWIASPAHLHCEHALAALRAGKHVVVDKPMAVSLAAADRLIETAQERGVALVAGHTSSFSPPIRAMRSIVQSGAIGAPRAIVIWSYTDWMLRPRAADEFDPALGGGIVMRQAPHQIDALRLLGGGLLRSVRATTGHRMPQRNADGFFSAHFEFEDGLPATIVHNGHGYFMTAELYPWAHAAWIYDDSDRIALRRALQDGTAPNLEKAAPAHAAPDTAGWSPIDLGMLVLSCERGDIRHSRYGLTVYDETGKREVDLRPFAPDGADLEGGTTLPALRELYDAAVYGEPAFHGGAWGRATLEATLAVAASSAERREIRLERQVRMPDAYDATFDLAKPAR